MDDFENVRDSEPLTVDRDISLDAEPLFVNGPLEVNEDDEPVVLDELEEVEEVEPEELPIDYIDLDVEGFEGYPEEEENDDSTDHNSGTSG